MPSNYDPLTRQYTGFWDGTFKNAWSDNPAWCYYDLATHPVIGAGLEEVNKWSLYEIGRYCDELVDDGYGGREPRFTCNTIFSSAADAISALNTLASVFRGMTYWGSNTVEPVADMPGPIRKIITPADVIDGEFAYQGTSLRDRHSVAIVSWNDPEDGYASKPEMVEDPESIELFGWRDLQLTAVACSSRGQARRLGLWALYSERAEAQTISFTVTAKHADFRPGDFFSVHDPYRAGARLGGKITGVEGKTFTLDAIPVEAAIGWKLTVETEEGGLEQLSILNVSGNSCTVAVGPTKPAIVGGAFILSSAAVSAQTFRVAAVMEQEGSTYGITATAHDPRKYRHIEEGLLLPDVPVSFMPTGRLGAPKAISAKSYTYWAGGTEHQGMTIGWTAPDDARVEKFVLDVKGPDDVAFRTVYMDEGVSFDLSLVTAGTWYFRVRCVSLEWGNSAWTESSQAVANLLEPLPPESLVFKSTSNTITVLPVFHFANAEFEFWRSSAALTVDQVESNASYLGTGSFFVDNKLNFDTVYYYYVRGVNIYGKSSWVTGQGKTTADVDDILDVILQEQQASPIGQWFQKEIVKISGNTEGSVNQRIGIVSDAVDSTRADLEVANQIISAELVELQRQLSEFALAEVWDPLLPYEKGSIVQWDGKLWRATVATSTGYEPSPSNPLWAKIGDFVSLTDAISDLAFRIENSETAVREIDGVVTPMASQLNSLAAMWREADEDEDGILDAALDAWDSKAEFSVEVKVRASQFEALSQRITVLGTSLGGLSSSVTTIEQSLTTEIESVAQSVTNLNAKMGTDISSAISSERAVRVTAEGALGTRIDNLSVVVEEDISAAIQQEAIVRAGKDEALAGEISSVRASTTIAQNTADQAKQATITNAAAVVDERNARTSADSAMATDISNVQSSINTLSTSVQTIASAQTTADGKANAMWGVKLQVNSNGQYVTAGVGLGLDNSGGTLQSNFIVQADKFTVINGINGAEQVPFAIENGQVVIRSAFIGTATITMAKIGGDLYSTNYVQGVSGWRLSRNGDFEINTTIPGQGRTLINNKGMRVFDAAGNIRVKIGDLT